MVESIILFFAALAQITGARRFSPLAHPLGLLATHGHAPHTVDGPSRSGGAPDCSAWRRNRQEWIRRLNSAWNVEVRPGYCEGGDIPEFWKSQGISANWRAEFGGTETVLRSDQPDIIPYPLEQPVPPPRMYSIDTRHLLCTWVQSIRALPVGRALATPTFQGVRIDVLSVLTKMEDDIEKVYKERKVSSGIQPLNQNWTLEAVGLLPNIDPKYMGWSGRADASVMALAVFSRVEFKDNSKGSPHSPTGYALREITMAGVGTPITLVKKTVSAFAIEGIAEAPDLSARSARVLLAKIAKWAQAEQRLVVVARHAIHLSGRTDLTAYYMKLGFEKVALDDGSYDLVYSGTPTNSDIQGSAVMDTDEWIGDRQFMVRLTAF